MALRGQRFELDLDAENFAFNIQDDDSNQPLHTFSVVKEITEREVTAPQPPKSKSKSGFPEHRPRKNLSAFKQRQQQGRTKDSDVKAHITARAEPSDRAIANHIGKKYGFDTEAKEKADISQENKERISQMSVEDIEEARAELMSNLDPTFIERLLKRANIEEDEQGQDWDKSQSDVLQYPNPTTEEQTGPTDREPHHHQKQVSFEDSEQEDTSQSDVTATEPTPLTTHFPVPPRDPSSYQELDPSSTSFLNDLKTHYFPSTPHDPSTLGWLQDPTEAETTSSAYAPTQASYAPSDIRFDFTGRLLPPSESSTIPVDQGLHHHGEAPESAGYTIPELALLVRSTLPNQRSLAYRTLGRVLYRLGRGDFGARGTELCEGLWGCVEHERPLEVMMAEANRTGGHVSAKAYATEGLWLWRKGNGGDRGILKPGERIAK